MNAANDLVDIIRDLIQQELSKKDSTTLCEVIEQVGEDHYNVSTVADPDTVLHNIVNMTKFTLKPGDFVYIYSLNGQLNNSFICYKLIPYILPSVTQGSGFVEKTYILDLILNKNNLNQDLGALAGAVFMAEVNDNSLGKRILAFGTDFEYTRPYYYQYYKSYWMLGKSKGVLGNLATFIFDKNITITKATFKLTNGFTINNTTKAVSANVSSLNIGVVALDKDDNVIGQRVTQTLGPLLRGTLLPDVEEYEVTIGDGKTPISSIMITGFPSSGRINLSEMKLQYL